MRFLEIDELPHFQFQKEFLRPFEHVVQNTSNVTVKDMILQCLNQMIKARADKIRSGWRTMFGVFTYAATEKYGMHSIRLSSHEQNPSSVLDSKTLR